MINSIVASNQRHGLKIYNSVANIRNCKFIANEGLYGSGLHMREANISITNTEFSGNVAAYKGDGIYWVSHSIKIDNASYNNGDDFKLESTCKLTIQ